jgi:hypothetical protein
VKILIACEWSGRVRDAFIAKGHDAYSCDVVPSEGINNEFHIMDDVRNHLDEGWDMSINFPPCNHLTTAGNGWYKPEWLIEESLEFVRTLMNANIPKICIENPVGRISTRIRRPDQIIEPWYFGDPYMKRTCLWLKGLPALRADNVVNPKYRAVGNHRDHGNSLHGSKERGKTFLGVARAMAEQWGKNPVDTGQG